MTTATLLACTPKTSSSPSEKKADSGSILDSGEVLDSADPTAPCADDADTFDALVVFMTEELEGRGVPGGSIAVVCDGTLAFSAGVGLTQAGGSQAVMTSTRFQIASVTKMFTAATAMSLAEDGLVSLHDPISEVLPTINTLAPYDTPATLHHLLSHTAGYATQFPGGDFSSYDLATFFQNNQTQPLWSPPGALFNYSNLGMSLAGLTLQTAASTPFGDLVQDRVFVPAGMARSTMSVDTVLSDGDYAHGHSGSTATSIGPRDSYYHTGYYGPMGGAWSSAEDLARWAQVHLASGGEVMEAASMSQLRTAHTPTGRVPGQTQGYALFMDTIYEEEVLSHTGSVPGFLTDWKLVPEAGFAVAVIVNADWYWPGNITERALEQFDVRGTMDSSMYISDPGDWPDLVGIYEDPHVLGTIRVTQTSSGLHAEFEDLGFESALSPVFDTTFSYVDVDYGTTLSLVFWRADESGPAAYLSTLRGVGARLAE